MIAVPTLYLFSAAQVNAERGTEKSRFDIVCDDGVAPKDNLHITTADQIHDITARSCMDDGRAKHEQYFTASVTSFFHLTSDLMDGKDFDFFSGDVALHESKRFAFTCTLKWMYTNAIMTDHY